MITEELNVLESKIEKAKEVLNGLCHGDEYAYRVLRGEA